MDPQKTWSVVADKLGAHWHTAVRRGFEGSRAKLGDLIFDLSDVEHAKLTLEWGCDRVVTRAISRTIEELAKDHLLRPDAMNPELAVAYGEAIRPECRQLLLEHIVQRFGIRIDLAKVGSDPMDGPCPPGFFCHHEHKCKGSV